MEVTITARLSHMTAADGIGGVVLTVLGRFPVITNVQLGLDVAERGPRGGGVRQNLAA